jgi:hypothetical protein
MERIKTGRRGGRDPNVLEQFQPIRAIQRYVDNKNVRPQSLNRRQSRVHLFGFTTDCEIGFPIDQQRQPLSHNWMIVNDEYGFLS